VLDLPPVTEPVAAMTNANANADNVTPKIDSPADTIEIPPISLPRDEIDEADKRIFVERMLGGNSPSVICRKLGYDLGAYHKTRTNDYEFDLAIKQALESLSDNVASRLYVEAIDGNVTAMSSWLKLRPPRDWRDQEEHTTHHNLLEKMTNEELIDLARIRGVEVPVELEPDPDSSRCSSLAAGISQSHPAQ
jgi:hypothetical protein